MYQQLRLWNPPRIDLTAKIKMEREMGKEVFYHWRGHPLIMRERLPSREKHE